MIRLMPPRPVMTCTLVGSCFLIFLLGPASGFVPSYGAGEALRHTQNAHFLHWGVVPRSLWTGAVAPLFTPFSALFLHGNWLHLLGNLLFLLIFGGPVEERMGGLRFVLCYAVAGYVSLLCYAAAHWGSGEAVVGASGAIAAVLGAFLYLCPKARVTSIFPFLFFVPLRLPAWTVLVFWLGLQWFAARGDTDGPGVAYLAHVVGFTLGFLYAWLYFRTAKVDGPAPVTKMPR
jgi:membrane associated rhomboid family serine protease